MNSLDALFSDIDDFCQNFEPKWHSHLIEGGHKTRRRAQSLCLSEIMTILVTFHQHHYRNFKHYYLDHVCVYWSDAFPGLPASRVTRHASYGRFVEWIPQTLLPLCAYLKQCFGACTGISCLVALFTSGNPTSAHRFIDSTCLKVCHNRRISGHKVFKNLAARGKTSVDWFFGFKLHVVVNENGKLLNMTLTPGNIDDRKPVPDLVSSLFGKIFADKGYVSQTFATQLFEAEGIEFFAKPRRNLKNKLMRSII